MLPFTPQYVFDVYIIVLQMKCIIIDSSIQQYQVAKLATPPPTAY